MIGIFRDIYKGGLWEDDLYVSVLKRVSPVLGFRMKTPVEHYLDDSCPVCSEIFRNQDVI